MSRDYPRLEIETFGKMLLESGDLDPVYLALHTLQHGSWGDAQVHRFLIAYWCLYHCGAAAYLSALEGPNFWQALMAAAVNILPAPTGARWPRGHERRHWRGAQAESSCLDLEQRAKLKPEALVRWIMEAGHEYEAVAGRVRELRGFGPWISFKVCDMLDRCLGHPVNFSSDAAFNGIFKDPWQAALRLWRHRCGLPEGARPKQGESAVVAQVVEHLRVQFQHFLAPPLGDRPVGIQEIETILCKWKSHMNGHYPPGNDIIEIHDGLAPWIVHSEAARQFKDAMPVWVGG